MIIRYEYHLMGKEPGNMCNYKHFLILIFDGKIKYKMCNSLYTTFDSITTLNTKELSQNVIDKIENEYFSYQLMVMAKEDEEDNEYHLDNKVVKMSVSFFEDGSENELDDNTLNYDGAKSVMGNSKTVSVIKDIVEWLGECLAIDGIELSYNRLKIDKRVIDCEF